MKRKQIYAFILSAAMVTTAMPINVNAADTVNQTVLEESDTEGKEASGDKPVIDYGAVDYTWEVEATDNAPTVEELLAEYTDTSWASCDDGIEGFVVVDNGYEFSQIDFKQPGDYSLNIYAKSKAGVLSYNVGITVRIQDTTAPTVTVPAEFETQEFALTNETLTEEQIVNTFVKKEWISDIVSENCSVAYRENQYPFDPSTEGTYRLMFQVKDEAGNMKKFTIKVKVTDQEGPKIDHSKVTADGGYNQDLEATQEAVDPLQFVKNEWLTDNNKNGKPHFVADTWFNENQENPFDPKTPGTYKLNYFTEDAAGNRGWSMSVTVTVKDTTAPTVTIPKEEQPVKFTLTKESIDEEKILSSVIKSKWITDNASGPLTVDYLEEESDFNPGKKGTYTLPFTVTDASGNKTEFTVEVQVVDENGPVIDYDQIAKDKGYHQTFEATKDEMSYEDMAEEFTKQTWAKDDSGEDVIFVCDWYFNEHLSGKPFNPSVPGEYTLRFSVQDSAGNPGNGVFDITVEVKDTTAPVVKVPDDMKTQEFDLAKEAMTEEQLIAEFVDQKWITDNAEGVVKVDYLESKSDFNAQKLGEYKLYFTAMDASGNTSEEFVIKVKVVDRELPTINYGQIEKDGGYGQTVEVSPKALDFDEMTEKFTKPNWAQDNSGDVEIKCDEYVFKNGITLDGKKYPAFDSTKIGTYALQFYAKDGSGNNSTQKFIVYVKVSDTTAPVVKVEGKWERTHEYGEAFIVPEATVTDNSGETLEAVMDRVTYAETKEGLDTSTDYSDKVDVNRLGWYKLRYCAVDSSGNRGYATIVVHVQDTTAPEGEVSYSTTEPTNQPVTVTITASEPVTAEGWTQDAENPNVLTKVYTENAEETVTIKDRSGNESQVEVKVSNIDTVAPEGEVSYSTTEPTNQPVTVTITASEPVTAEGWGQNAENPNVLTKVYNENTTESVTIRDVSGNTSTVEVKVSNIDKTAPKLTVTMTPNSPTNKDVTVTIQADEAIKIADESWTKADDKTWTKVYSENVDAEEVTVADLAGNTAKTTITITNIDKETPILVSADYSATDPTNEDVTVTLTFNEDVTVETEGWNAVDGQTKVWNKVFAENAAEDVKATDAAGNTLTIPVKVENIDKTAPQAEVTYSETELTNKDVKVTVQFTEPVVVNGKGWIVDSEDQTVWAKLFTENAEEAISATDAAGNETEIEVKVDNIDKIAPVISGVEDGKTYAEKVTAVIKEKNLAEVTVNGKVREYKDKLVFEKDGSYTLAATDTAGNRTEVTFEVKLPKKAEGTDQNQDDSKKAVKTGDTANVLLPTAGALVAAAVLALRKRIFGR